MTIPVIHENIESAPCPTCGEPMRREFDGVRIPPMPTLFWFCINIDCKDGTRNKLYMGG